MKKMFLLLVASILSMNSIYVLPISASSDSESVPIITSIDQSNQDYIIVNTVESHVQPALNGLSVEQKVMTVNSYIVEPKYYPMLLSRSNVNKIEDVASGSVSNNIYYDIIDYLGNDAYKINKIVYKWNTNSSRYEFRNVTYRIRCIGTTIDTDMSTIAIDKELGNIGMGKDLTVNINSNYIVSIWAEIGSHTDWELYDKTTVYSTAGSNYNELISTLDGSR